MIRNPIANQLQVLRVVRCQIHAVNQAANLHQNPLLQTQTVIQTVIRLQIQAQSQVLIQAVILYQVQIRLQVQVVSQFQTQSLLQIQIVHPLLKAIPLQRVEVTLTLFQDLLQQVLQAQLLNQ